MSVRLRFAPSPTGYLHVGGARTALFNWLYVKAKGGQFILRIEDTDTVRSTEEALQMQIEDLQWLKLDWDEGPLVGGPHAPYRQSERTEIYKEHTDRLLSAGKAFYCFCSDELLEAKKQKAMENQLPPHYDGTCRKLSKAEVDLKIANGEAAAVRFWVKNKKDYQIKDLIRGDVTFPMDMVGDFVILRTGGLPVYNYCCVIDDALMKITHVLRAEEHLNNTVRQLMLYEAFGYQVPTFGHMSLIVGADRQKLSKREGATSVHEFKEQGFLPEALKNYIALLGWSSPDDKEIMTIEEMTKGFDTDRMNPAPAAFDEAKLRWMNGMYIRAMPNEELWLRVEPFLKGAGLEFPDDQEWRSNALSAMKTAMEVLTDAVALFTPLADNQYLVTEDGLQMIKGNVPVVKAWAEELKKGTGVYLTEAEFDDIQKRVKEATGASGKNLFQPIRVAVVGKTQGTEVKKLIHIITRASLIGRAERAMKAMGL